MKYRLLRVGEMIKRGDYYFVGNSDEFDLNHIDFMYWFECEWLVGKVNVYGCKIIRPIQDYSVII